MLAAPPAPVLTTHHGAQNAVPKGATGSGPGLPRAPLGSPGSTSMGATGATGQGGQGTMAAASIRLEEPMEVD